MHEGPVPSSIEELVYMNENPVDRVDQARRVARALADVVDERRRQEEIGLTKRGRGIDWRSCADPAMAGGDFARSTVLGEEYGEVCRSALEIAYGSDALEHLREELVQTAAVAVAWIESIDSRLGR